MLMWTRPPAYSGLVWTLSESAYSAGLSPMRKEPAGREEATERRSWWRRWFGGE